MSREKITLTTHDALFKEYYIPITEAAINQATPALMRLKYVENFVGERIRGCARLSLGRGVGNKVIPRGSTPKEEKVLITDKALWATSVLDWQAVVASSNDKGAFLRVTADEIEGTVSFFSLNKSRQIFGTSEGSLGTMDGNAPIDNTGGSYSFTLSAATWFRPYWEAGMLINFHTDTDKFEVTSVNHATRTVTVLRVTGSFDPSGLDGTQKLFMQDSKDSELIGLREIGAATSSTLYNVNVGAGWQAVQRDADDKPLIPDLLVESLEDYNNRTGGDVNILFMNPIQYVQIANLLEGQKEYTQIKSRDERYADVGWRGLVFNHRRGQTIITTDRMCGQDEIFGVYESDWKFYKRPMWGWLNSGGAEGGTRYLKDFNVGDVPRFMAHYGGYGEHFHHPARLLYIHSLEVPPIFG
jgi:hypothetical protein